LLFLPDSGRVTLTKDSGDYFAKCEYTKGTQICTLRSILALFKVKRQGQKSRSNMPAYGTN